MDIKKNLCFFYHFLPSVQHRELLWGTDHFPVHCNDVACAGAVTQRGHVAVEAPAGRAALGSARHHRVGHPVGNQAGLGHVPVHQHAGGSVG